MKKIAVLASGSGTNAENLVRYFEGSEEASVATMICDRKEAFVFERMKKLGVHSYYIRKDELYAGGLLNILRQNEIDLVVLAGFLKLVPQDVIDAFPRRIINVHPALLPKFGGKGMFGMHVHTAVVNAGETKTGITIHYVNEHFDEGEIIAQFETDVLPEDTPESVAKKIHELEMRHFPEVVGEVVSGIVG
jgi:phosphoribosylglycinamide formyltransferase-1